MENIFFEKIIFEELSGCGGRDCSGSCVGDCAGSCYSGCFGNCKSLSGDGGGCIIV